MMDEKQMKSEFRCGGQTKSQVCFSMLKYVKIIVLLFNNIDLFEAEILINTY